MRTWRFGFIANYTIFYAIICKYSLADGLNFFLGYVSGQCVFSGCANMPRLFAHISDSGCNRFGDRVCHPAFEMDFDGCHPRRSCRRLDLADSELFTDRVSQKLRRHPAGKSFVEISLYQIYSCELYRFNAINAKLAYFFKNSFTFDIPRILSLKNLYAPLLHDSNSLFSIL